MKMQTIVKKTVSKHCEQHAGYRLIYCCKDCSDKFICPECAIHGLHQGHCVVAVQKEAELVKVRLER